MISNGKRAMHLENPGVLSTCKIANPNHQSVLSKLLAEASRLAVEEEKAVIGTNHPTLSPL
jgi:hypothetical protein